MDNNLFHGKLVRLTSDDPETMGKAFSRWGRDSEYMRLLGSDQAQLWSAKKFKEWHEKEQEKEPPEGFLFNIRTLDGDTLIGFIGLFGIHWNHGDAWVGIGLGEREFWGRGYGTDAMRLILCYAFRELNLYRITLGAFAYNARAIRSYEKAGFIIEGRERQVINRDGSRWDVLEMGVMRAEWEKNVNSYI
jgi:RimJ/RimL family protein N-acetyltransferase